MTASEIADDVHIGPFAHLRGNSRLASDVRIGNFVELKNAELAEGVKANHLAYLGDAKIGPRSNVGAGTITANFDGVRKNRTEIGADVKIGSNNTLVAPVSVGDAATTGAGAVVTRDVEPGDKVVGVPARRSPKNPCSCDGAASARFRRLRRDAARSEVAGRGAARRADRDELRGGLGVRDRRRRRDLRDVSDRSSRRDAGPGEARSDRRVRLRVRQPRGLLAAHAHVRRARHPDHRVRRGARARAQSRSGGGDSSRGLRGVLARLALDRLSEHGRGRRARADAARRRVDRAHDRDASVRAGTAATRRRSTRAGWSSRRAGFSTTPTRTTTTCRTGRASAASRIW